MQVKVYLPQTVEIPSEFLPALVQRAFDQLPEAAKNTPATRGHLVRQAVLDGLLRKLDGLIGEDGEVDLFCDPFDEIPLEIDSRTLALNELLEVLHTKNPSWVMKGEDLEQFRTDIVPRRRVA